MLNNRVYKGNTEMGENGWMEYQKLVLHELKQLNDSMTQNSKDHVTMREDIAKLKVKSGVWGLIGGAIPSSIAIIYMLMKSL